MLHAASLLGDSYFHPSIAALTMPFVSNYRAPFMALGIVAGWGMVIFGLSYYLRERIGVARWKVLHRFTALAWILGVIHTLGEGTDAGRSWFLAMIALAVGPPLTLVLGGWSGARDPAAHAPAAEGPPRTPLPVARRASRIRLYAVCTGHPVEPARPAERPEQQPHRQAVDDHDAPRRPPAPPRSPPRPAPAGSAFSNALAAGRPPAEVVAQLIGPDVRRTDGAGVHAAARELVVEHLGEPDERELARTVRGVARPAEQAELGRDHDDRAARRSRIPAARAA